MNRADIPGALYMALAALILLLAFSTGNSIMALVLLVAALSISAIGFILIALGKIITLLTPEEKPVTKPQGWGNIPNTSGTASDFVPYELTNAPAQPGYTQPVNWQQQPK